MTAIVCTPPWSSAMRTVAMPGPTGASKMLAVGPLALLAPTRTTAAFDVETVKRRE